jgi:flavin-dependent dehydrogenase
MRLSSPNRQSLIRIGDRCTGVAMLALQSDVLVIGGGPAGLAAAIAARLKGFDVTVIDTARPPIDKACGEGVLPDGVEALRRLGVSLTSEDGFPFRGIRFVDKGGSLEAPFQGGIGLALRRTRLHAILTSRASELGIRLLWGTRATDTCSYPSRQWIVGADGMNSAVRRDAGLDASTSHRMRFGFRRHYRLPPWTHFVEVHWGARCQIYVTPVSPEEIGIALLTRDSHVRLDDALQQFPELQTRLRSAKIASAARGGVTVSRHLSSVIRDRTALIGDASGSVDAITGDGLSLAFRQAIALSEALWSGDIASYQAEHRRLSRPPALIGSLLLQLDRFPLLRRSVFGLLALEPAILAKLLAIVATGHRR